MYLDYHERPTSCRMYHLDKDESLAPGPCRGSLGVVIGCFVSSLLRFASAEACEEYDEHAEE